MKKISLIIINNNAYEYLPKLFNSIPHDVKEKIEIILINNYTVDSNLNDMCNLDCNEVYNFDETIYNKGILFNKGVELAKSKYVLFAHADIYFYSDFFYKVFDLLEEENKDIVNFEQLYADYSIIGQNELYFNQSSRTISIRKLFEEPIKKSECILTCSEACFLINSELFKTLKFNNEYKNSFYEYEFLLNAKLQGKNIVIYDDCKIVHYFIEEYEKVIDFIEDRKIFIDKNFFVLKDIPKLGDAYASVHFDVGSGINENDFIESRIDIKNDKARVRFNLENINNIVFLRFDPIEGYCCSYRLLTVNTDIKNVKFNVINSSYNNDDTYIFLNLDPMVGINGDFTNVTFLEIEYELRILELSDILKGIELLNHKTPELAKIKSALSDTLKNEDLLRIKSLHTWNWRIRDLVIPCNSRRRLFTKLIYKMVNNPVTILENFNSMRIRKFIYYLKTEGIIGVSQRMEEYLKNTKIDSVKLDIMHVFLIQKINECEKLEFPKVESPIVSIIIPVYNQFSYTYHCLHSILKNSGNVPYEVIVANDGSTDLTTKIEDVVENVVVINNDQNMHFLRNCNHAAKHAKGKYILFLNNDTQVQANWLTTLVDLIERDSTIGMVGSKLVYQDGRLQEAGGIIWKDAAAWNYGRLSNPNNPEFNYVKEVDYISGASIMIQKELWKKIGGFDELYAPAYYEDVDLAFEIRRQGYKVMYQPQSMVVHFEGISNGTDTTNGQKSFQIKNKEKFYEKWNNVLKKEHFSNGENVFSARDRSKDRKTILVIDHYVPTFDKDAGSRCLYMYIKLFVKRGMRVIFIGDNYAVNEPYTSCLQQLGVEVLYGEDYSKNWLKWLQINGSKIDYVYTLRAHISIKYIDYLKKYTKAKIIYFNVDMQDLRLYRQYEITGNDVYLKQAKEAEKLERFISEKADVLHVVSTYEEKLLNERFPSKLVRTIPIYIYENLELSPRNISVTSGILFVGGFQHQPNVDAVLWFYENIFPELLKHQPNLIWYIVGSKPPESIKVLNGEHIVVTGYVSDEELSEYYAKCRLAVMPLAFGAGVKGKVVEAAYYGIPMVTTLIGIEGLSREEDAFIVADMDATMINTILKVYTDDNELQKLSNNERKFIRNHFSLECADRVIEMDIN